MQDHKRIGFWSVNFRTCAVTWDETTAAIHGMQPGHAPTLHEALAFFLPPDRARVVHSALAAFDSRTLFDIRATIASGPGTARVRLIGGRGYDARSNYAELHGIIETAPDEPPVEDIADASTSLPVVALLHELEGRIASIGMLSTAASREPGTLALMRARMDGIAGAAAQMQRIASAVRALQANEPPMRERIDASAMAATVLRALVDRNPGYAHVRVTIAPGLELDGDPREIEIVLDNLLGNALKFSAIGAEPQVSVTSSWQNEHTVLHVSDNGVGFDPGDASRIFELFTRRCDVAFPGTGVGLAIARHIVARHSGLIWAEGTPGKGSTFSFYL